MGFPTHKYAKLWGLRGRLRREQETQQRCATQLKHEKRNDVVKALLKQHDRAGAEIVILREAIRNEERRIERNGHDYNPKT